MGSDFFMLSVGASVFRRRKSRNLFELPHKMLIVFIATHLGYFGNRKGSTQKILFGKLDSCKDNVRNTAYSEGVPVYFQEVRTA